MICSTNVLMLSVQLPCSTQSKLPIYKNADVGTNVVADIACETIGKLLSTVLYFL